MSGSCHAVMLVLVRCDVWWRYILLSTSNINIAEQVSHYWAI